MKLKTHISNVLQEQRLFAELKGRKESFWNFHVQ